MTSQELANALLEQFGPEVVEEVSSDAIQPWIRISPNKIQEVCSFAKNAPEFAFDFLRSIAGVDYQESIELNYFLFSYPHKHELYIKSRVPIEAPKISSVENIWPAANWHEREAFDLLGVVFANHSDLRRILLPDDWEGHPLRKSYREKDSYQGVSTTRHYLTGMPELPIHKKDETS